MLRATPQSSRDPRGPSVSKGDPSLVGSRTQLHAHWRASVGHRQTRRAYARLCLMGDPSQDAAQAAFRLGSAITARSLQVFKANATLALHPCQTAAAHLPCTPPPYCWVLIGRPRARSRPDGHRDRAAARAFVTTRTGLDTMSRRRQDDADEITESDHTAGAATFGGSSLRDTR
jgi:hypothetical protein